MKIFFIILVIFVFSYQPVFAEQWYDRIPESGEYKPLPEPGTELVPEDFQSLNEDIDKINTEDVSGNQEVGVPLEEEVATTADNEQSQKGSLWPYLSLIVVVILLASFAYGWWKKNSKKLENDENN
jgi:hypothetical protein